MEMSCQVGAHRVDLIMVHVGKLPMKAPSLERAFQTSGNNGKPIIGPIVKYCFRHKIILPAQNQFQQELQHRKSFLMPTRTGQLSFEKLQNNFRTEICPKTAFNTIYKKHYFLCFLAITFLIETLLPLGRRTGNGESFCATPFTVFSE